MGMKLRYVVNPEGHAHVILLALYFPPSYISLGLAKREELTSAAKDPGESGSEIGEGKNVEQQPLFGIETLVF